MKKVNIKNIDKILGIVLLSVSLMMPMLGHAQSKTTDKNNKSNKQQVQVDYLTETYQFSNNKFTEYDLRKHIEELTGVVAVQINTGSSTIVVKFDKSKNSKSKLKKSFKKLGVSGNFIDSNKKERKESKTVDVKNNQSKESSSNRENQNNGNGKR